MHRIPLVATLLAVGTALGLAGCGSTGSTGSTGLSDSPAADLAELTRWMTGTFDSTAQAAERPDEYRPIRLVMLPIWEDRDDGPWLYVEQAVIGAEGRPYRQRVYRLSTVGLEGFRSDVFELPEDPLGFAAAWENPGVWKTCAPEDLLPRQGCAIHLRRRSDGTFAGETRGTGCRSRLGEAAYATSEVVLARDRVSSWDRGFTAEHEQAWGAESGPYEFRRVSSGPPRR